MEIISFFIFCFFGYLLFKPSSSIPTIEVNPFHQLEEFILMKKQYLTTQQWKQKRQLVLTRDHHRCTSCGTYQNLTVHHDHGYALIPNEPISSLRTLCRKCHRAFHNQHGYPQFLNEYYTWDTRGIPFKHSLLKVTYEQNN